MIPPGNPNTVPNPFSLPLELSPNLYQLFVGQPITLPSSSLCKSKQLVEDFPPPGLIYLLFLGPRISGIIISSLPSFITDKLHFQAQFFHLYTSSSSPFNFLKDITSVILLTFSYTEKFSFSLLKHSH